MARRLSVAASQRLGNWPIEGGSLPRCDQCDRNLIQRDKHISTICTRPLGRIDNVALRRWLFTVE
jgi:hypothetical protein